MSFPRAARLDNNLHRVRLRMGSQIQRFHAALQREAVADKPFQIYFTVHYEPHRLLLQFDRCAVGPHQSLFVHAHRRRIDRRLAAHSLGKQQHPTSGTGGIHGRPDHAVPANRQYHGVSPATFRHFAHRFSGVSLGSVNCQIEAEAISYCKPRRMQIGSNHPSPCPLRQSRKDDTYWTLPNHQHGLPRFQAKRLNTFDAGIHRLDKTCLLEADAVRDAHRSLLDNPIHYPDIFRKSSARRLEAGRASDLLVSCALREGLVLAVITFSTRDMMKHNDAIADSELTNAFANLRDDTRSLVTENARSGVRAGSDLLEISS